MCSPHWQQRLADAQAQHAALQQTGDPITVRNRQLFTTKAAAMSFARPAQANSLATGSAR